MIPMVTSVEEMTWVAARMASVKAQLAADGVPFDPSMPVGAMLEVPAACLIIEQLAQYVEFFSIGTNDLAQYFAAADRTNAAVSALASPLHPGFLTLLEQSVRRIHDCGKQVAVCGEMASDPACLPLMLGLGVDELSVTPARIPMLKEELRALSASACRTLLARAMRSSTASEVRALLEAPDLSSTERPLLDPDLVWIDAPVTGKADALRALADLLLVTGRTRDADAIERALGAREATYSTDLGNGFAVPHCKSEAVGADSIGLLRLRHPIAWDDASSETVDVVIVLATHPVHAAQKHLRLFAQLARRLMDPEFRASLRAARDPAVALAELSRALVAEQSA
jgi:fructose-specific PTS system IIA-like component